MTQQRKRHLSLIGIFAFSIFLFWLGDDYLISSVPAEYVGFIVVLIGLAGVFGINIWAGGPLDLKRDADATED